MSDTTTLVFNKTDWLSMTVLAEAHLAAHRIADTYELSNEKKLRSVRNIINNMTSISETCWYMYNATRKGRLIKSRMDVNLPPFPRPQSPKDKDGEI